MSVRNWSARHWIEKSGEKYWKRERFTKEKKKKKRREGVH
jgi:hypothetical protein